jgi:hypothetical protein
VARLKRKLHSVHLEMVLILTQDRWRFAPNVPPAHEIIVDAPDVLLGDVGHVESHFGLF